MGYRVFSGYTIKGNQKRNWEVRAGSKAHARAAIKETHPGWRVCVVESYIRGLPRRRTRC